MKHRNQPETLRLASVTPSLTVNDLAASIAWYRDVLGFVVVDEIDLDDAPVGAVVRAGGVDILLRQDDFNQGRGHAKGVGFRLYCATRQNINDLAAIIIERGGELEQELKVQPWGEVDFAVVDPDGFQISISTGEE